MEKSCEGGGVNLPQQHRGRHLLRFNCKLGSLTSPGTRRERGRERESNNENTLDTE